MDAKRIQGIFNSTVIKDIEIEILSTQHEIEKRHWRTSLVSLLPIPIVLIMSQESFAFW